MQDPHTFAQMKAKILPAITASLPNLEKIKSCVNASKNSEDLNGCVDIMMAFQKKMMGGAAGPANVPEHNTQSPRMKWSAELKERILADLSQSIKNTTAAKGCLESSSNNAQMSSCMEAAGIKRQQPPRR
ncbi:hypothetical protein [Solemya velesiana gill symbiont]|uniref:Uncharacterized protein n=1 Tax=Solemya velesiana gill symbiont TaxID=1918948 RepID=A0A1T2KXR4_9GAMM|nr:hypothetical protein [Solemya velesiana gill symbiont]OOZ37657.1 hypothetical protein BOW51_01345 [Solemya velesiana gill symbiont]